MRVGKPSPSEYNAYYSSYINRAISYDIPEGLEVSKNEMIALLKSIGKDKQTYRYNKDKWSIKEIFQHLIDSERVFAYRALRIGRGDKTPLPGFEQDDYIEPSNANQRDWHNMIEEYNIVRASTIKLYEHFTQDQMLHLGTASGSNVSVRALAYMIIGHEKHHAEIINSRYL